MSALPDRAGGAARPRPRRRPRGTGPPPLLRRARRRDGDGRGGARLPVRRALLRRAHRGPGRRQVHLDGPAHHRGAGRLAGRGGDPPGGGAGRRSDLALQRGRHPGRPGAHGSAHARPDGLHPVDGHPRPPGRAVPGRSRCHPPARRRRAGSRHRRDGRRGADGGGHRVGRRHHGGRRDARAGATPCRRARPASWRWPTSS